MYVWCLSGDMADLDIANQPSVCLNGRIMVDLVSCEIFDDYLRTYTETSYGCVLNSCWRQVDIKLSLPSSLSSQTLYVRTISSYQYSRHHHGQNFKIQGSASFWSWPPKLDYIRWRDITS